MLKKVQHSWDYAMEPKNQIKTRIIQELTTELKLTNLLKETKFPKSIPITIGLKR